MRTTLKEALAYCKLGLSVIPLKRDKRAYESWQKYQNEQATEQQIIKWWNMYPDANVGIVTGKISDLLVIDVDSREALQALKDHLSDVKTPVAVTPKGWHYYFRNSDNVKNMVKFIKGCDVRAEGGYVVAPPSVNDKGQFYKWRVSTEEVRPARLPGSLMKLLDHDKQSKSPMREIMKGVADGERNVSAAKLAGMLFGRGMPREFVLATLQGWNEKLSNPPLEDREIRTVVDSIAKAEARKRQQQAKEILPELTIYGQFNPTDLGNAERFAKQHGDKVKYDWTDGRWVAWDGKRWNPHIGTETAIQLAGKTARSILIGVERIQDPERRKKVIKWSFASESDRGIQAMLRLARASPSISCHAEDFDQDQQLLNIRNGTVDLRTGTLKAHDPKDMITMLAPLEWDGHVGFQKDKAPLWFSALKLWMQDNDQDINYLKRLAGMVLGGHTANRTFILFYGEGANGKSTFVDCIKAMMGDYATVAARDLLKQKYQYEQHTTDIAELRGKRLVTSSETRANMKLNTALIKQHTGDAELKGRFMRQDNMTFKTTHTLILMTNDLPVVEDQSSAWWERLQMLEWKVKIAPKDQDLQFQDKLRAEWPYILGWMIEGYLEWQRDTRLIPSQNVTVGTQQYKVSQMPLRDFLDDRCVVEPTAFIKTTELKAAYGDYAKEKLSMQAFTKMVKSAGFEKCKKKIEGKSTSAFQGVRLKEDWDE